MAGIKDQTLQPKGYQQLTVTNAAVGLTVPAGATRALFKVDGAIAIRWRDDAVDPSATVGMFIDAGDEFWYTGQLRAIKFFSAGASTFLNISYYA